MAKTQTWGEVLNMNSAHIPRNVQDERGAKICNMATDFIWHRYDWRESLNELPPFYLTPLTQDHGSPAFTIPTDFYGLRTAFLVCMAGSNSNQRWPLKITKDLEDTSVIGLPTSIAFRPAKRVFGVSYSTKGVLRVHPRVPEGVGCPDYKVDGTYKTRTVLLTPATFQTAIIPFDDMYLRNIFSVVRYIAWDLAGDPRAGELQFAGSHLVGATAGAAKALSAVDEMAMSEGVELGDPIIAPSRPLVDISMGYF